MCGQFVALLGVNKKSLLLNIISWRYKKIEIKKAEEEENGPKW